MNNVNVSVFSPIARQNLVEVNHINTFDKDITLTFTATESSTQFYITKGWSVASVTSLESITLDYLYIQEHESQQMEINCEVLNSTITYLLNTSVNMSDSNIARNSLNNSFKRNLSYAAYQQAITSCTNTPGVNTLAEGGVEFEEVRGGYRFGFNGKEDDKELIDWQDYRERMYMRRLGRFPSPDPLIKKYPMLTPYQFASNTPIQAVDLDGLEAFYVHGAWSNPATFSKLTVSTVNQIMGNTTGKEFKWSGNNTDRARRKAARDLANHIMKNRDPNQPLTIVGHSHGGNVSIMAANILKQRGIQVDNIVTINTPVREYQLDQGAAEKHVNIYQHYDPVQGGGGNTINILDGANVVPMPAGAPLLIPTFDGSVKGTGEMGPAGRTFGNAINIDVPFDKNNVHNTHNTPNLWQGDLNNAINPPPMQPLDLKPPQVEPAKQDNTYVAPRR